MQTFLRKGLKMLNFLGERGVLVNYLKLVEGKKTLLFL